MTVQVQLKNKATGEITTHFSVDAAEILPRGEHEQIGGPAIAFRAPPAPPTKEPGPPVLKSEVGKPSLKSARFGKFDVIKADGTKANIKPLKKADAEALLATIE